MKKRELELFEAIKVAGEISMDDLVLKFGTNRHALGVRMKYLAAKVAPDGWIITNEASIGRGRKTVYKIEKKF